MTIEAVRTLGRPAKMLSWAFVEVRCNGVTGIGMTSAPASAIHAIISCPSTGMARLLIGKDVRDVNGLMRTLTANWQAERGRGEEGGLAVNAVAAIEEALWDALGKITGQPLHRMFGGAQTNQVQVYASGSAFNEQVFYNERRLVRRTTEELVAMARKYVSDGFTAFKLGWGNHYSDEAMETLRAVREAVGPGVRFMLDFGCPAYFDDRWSLKEAIRVSERLAEVQLDFWEEPLRPRDFKGFAALTKASPVRIATGESLTRFDEFQQLIEARAVDVVQPDIGQLGVSAFWQIAQSARAAGIACVPHGPWGSPFVSGHVQLLGCLSPDNLVEYPAQFSSPSRSKRDEILDCTHNRLFTQTLTVERGHVVMPQRPGLGLGDWVHAEVERFEALLLPT